MKEIVKNIYFLLHRSLPARFRFGKTFWDTYNFLEKSQWWSKERLEEYQLYEIQRLVRHAYKNVPYYTLLFNEHGINPDKIQDFNDFKKIPYLTKELVNENNHLLKSKRYDAKLLKPATTSGTSGKTMHFWRDYSENRPKEKAIVWRMWNIYGYSWNDRSVIIKGNLKIPSKAVVYNTSDKSLGIYNPVFNLANIREYLNLIDDYKPVVIRGYPSLVYSLAHVMLSNNISVQWPWLRFVYCHSEKIYNSQITAIEKAFNTKVRYNYGHTERCVFMHTCETNTEYHILPEYGYTEFLTSKNNDGLGEIVGTGFYNYGFPFIRYRTGDWATLPHADSCSCGRNFQLVHDILGRSGDFIVTPTGGFVSPTILEMGREFISNYKDILIVQHDIDNLHVQIVPEPDYSEEDSLKLKNFLLQRIGELMNIEIKLVDNITRPGTDKKRFVVSKLSGELLRKTNEIT